MGPYINYVGGNAGGGWYGTSGYAYTGTTTFASTVQWIQSLPENPVNPGHLTINQAREAAGLPLINDPTPADPNDPVTWLRARVSEVIDEVAWPKAA